MIQLGIIPLSDQMSVPCTIEHLHIPLPLLGIDVMKPTELPLQVHEERATSRCHLHDCRETRLLPLLGRQCTKLKILTMDGSTHQLIRSLQDREVSFPAKPFLHC
jgi:dihydroorotase